MYDLLLKLGMKGLRQSDIFKSNFHQQTKAFWGKIKFSKINLVLSPWFCLQSYMYLILWFLIIRKLPIYHWYMAYIHFFLVLYWFVPFLKFGPLPSQNPRCAPVQDGYSFKGVSLTSLEKKIWSQHLISETTWQM